MFRQQLLVCRSNSCRLLKFDPVDNHFTSDWSMLFHILEPSDSFSAFFTCEAAVSHYFLVTETSLFLFFLPTDKSFGRLYGRSGQDPVAKILLMYTTKNTLKTDRKMIPMSNLHCFKTIKFVFIVLVCCPLAAPAWIFNLDFKLKEEKYACSNKRVVTCDVTA